MKYLKFKGTNLQISRPIQQPKRKMSHFPIENDLFTENVIKWAVKNLIFHLFDTLGKNGFHYLNERNFLYNEVLIGFIIFSSIINIIFPNSYYLRFCAEKSKYQKNLKHV